MLNHLIHLAHQWRGISSMISNENGIGGSGFVSQGSWPSLSVSGKPGINAEKEQVNMILKAVHSDLLNKQNRARNVIVFGLKPSRNFSDLDLFNSLGLSHFDTMPTPVHCSRIGRTGVINDDADDKIRPLKVGFASEAAAKSVIDQARRLRQSCDDYIKSNVFINRDLTKAEREAEFERRQKNKQRRLQTLAKSQSGRRIEIIAMESTSSTDNQQLIVNKAADKQLSASTPAFYPSSLKESITVVVAATNDAAQIDGTNACLTPLSHQMFTLRI